MAFKVSIPHGKLDFEGHFSIFTFMDLFKEPTMSSDSNTSVNRLLQLLKEHYNLTGTLKKLPGEEDYNFYLETECGKELTVKLSRPNADLGAIQFQASLMNHLEAKNLPIDLPTVVPTKDNDAFVLLEDNSFLRAQKWVNGAMLSDAPYRSPELLHSWGATCGLFSKELANFDHPAAHRFYKWNPSESLYSRDQYREYITDKQQLAIADYYWNLFEKEALPHLKSLRKSVNYNDAHEHNFLINSNDYISEICGVIDFGDALYCETINELAIASAYAGMYMEDPLEAIKEVVRGYHSIFPIQEKELAVLFPLICGRLMITVSSSAYNKFKEPENEYLFISEKPAWALLKKLQSIHPKFAEYTFRETCGFSPHPKSADFKTWINNNLHIFSPIIDFDDKKVKHIDLSVGSLALGNNSNFENNNAFTKTVNKILEDKNADIGIGGYKEVRPFYTTDAYEVTGNSGPQWRTVHLGIDVWAPAGTPVYVPMDGIIHSFQNNDKDLDYGPTIIIEHSDNENLSFYSLYGHLSIESLKDMKQGVHVKAGEQIGWIGSAPENGNWPPHLHFQIMLDTLDRQGDFPGVSFPSELSVWGSICPDPSPFFPKVVPTQRPKNLAEILNSRKNHLGKSLSISYQKPLHMVRGYKQYLYDSSGRKYLDTVNNVAHVGHQHPRVVRAAQQQIGLLNTNTRYLHENIVLFAEELLATFPPELSVVHFVNSGSEANELALRMAQNWSNQKDMLAVEVGYHGNTGGTIDISSYKFDGKGGKGAPPHTHIVPMPDTYRGIYKDKKTAADLYVAHIIEAIKSIQNEGKNIAGFICESILSCGGQIVLPEGYLQKAYAAVRAAGGLCIADEVQVGFGRVGDFFWGFELQGVVPDIVTMGKPIGNGHPLAAVVTTQAVAESFANGMEYFNTFGGNPVSCAIGRAVLQVIKEEGLQMHAKKMGGILTKGFRKLQSRHELIGDVRGHGLFLGMELVRDKETLEAADTETAYLANRMSGRGILMSTDGPLHNVLKVKPPMCFSEKDANRLLEELDYVLRQI